VACAAGGALRDLLGTLPENGYGLCGGSRYMKPDEAGVLPLTDWVYQFFQDVANRPLDRPVTFGDLWDTNGDVDAPRDIQLVLMTTNNHARHLITLPVPRRQLGQLYFKEAEFAALFPTAIVTWMKGHAAEPRHRDKVEVAQGFFPIPAPQDLPILLGARMSPQLSVPRQRPASLCREFRAPAAERQISAGAVLVFRWRPDQQLSDPLLRRANPEMADLRHQSCA
jgi:hypothetical protein